MRLAAQAKSGYYPLDPRAMALIAPKLSVKHEEAWTLVDPCCGEGIALHALGSLTRCQYVFGAELDAGRIEAARERLPEARIEGPCDFLGMNMSAGWASCVYVNPPFDSDGQGGRLEERFIRQARSLLTPGGILIAVVPEPVVDGWTSTKSFIATTFRDMSIVRVPQQWRPYREVVIFGTKRTSIISEEDANDVAIQDDWRVIEDGKYSLPIGFSPTRWKKNSLTEDEVAAHAAKSPLNRLFQQQPEWTVPRPPMSLGKGHIALLLSAGHLDGTITKDGVSHVVRGVTRKEQYLKSQEERENEDGKVTTVTVLSERMKPIVRTAWEDGRILTHE